MNKPVSIGKGASAPVIAAETVTWVVAALCALYAAATIYGVAAGYALPLATIFDLAGNWLVRVEELLPIAIIATAACGAASAWLASLDIISAEPIRAAESLLARRWRRLALPAMLCLFAFSLGAGGWSGHIRNSDQLYSSWAGLVPHSDSYEYFAGTFHHAYAGDWMMLGTRRPLAQAFRDVIVFASQYSYVTTLLIQLVLFALAAYVATRTVARWRGAWVGLAFFAMTYALARPFLYTTLTEPLGLIFGLFSLVFFIESLRRESLAHALLALALLTAALLMRMGSLFTIPFLILWIAYAFGNTGRQHWRAGMLTCTAVVVVVLFSILLGHLYGTTGTMAGANGAWTLCGLATGSDWQGCQHAYAAQLAQLPDEAARARFLVVQSLQYMLRHPATLLHSLLKNAIAFLVAIPSLIPGRFELPLAIKIIALPLFIPGLVLTWRRLRAAERLFWIAVLASVTTSAAAIFADDGWRALCVTHVYLACALAFAFAAPGVPASEQAVKPETAAERHQWLSITAAVAATAALFIVVPAMARVEATRDGTALASAATSGEQVVLGGRRLTGFLVIPDGAPRPLSIPALTLSEFAAIWEWQGPDLGPLDDDLRRRVPFAVVFGLRPADGDGSIYIAPPQVLERRDVEAWEFKVEPANDREHWQSSIAPIAAADPVP